MTNSNETKNIQGIISPAKTINNSKKAKDKQTGSNSTICEILNRTNIVLCGTERSISDKDKVTGLGTLLTKERIGNQEVQNFEYKVLYEFWHSKQDQERQYKILDPETLKALHIEIQGVPGIITKVGKKYNMGGQVALQVQVDNRRYLLINPDTLEKLDLKVKGTELIISQIWGYTHVGDIKVLMIKVHNNDNWTIIKPDTLEAIKVKGTEDVIDDTGTEFTNSESGVKILRVPINGSSDSVFVNPVTFEAIKVKGTSDVISEIFIKKKYLIQNREVQMIQINNKDSIFVDANTFEKIDISIKGTDYNIVDILEQVSELSLRVILNNNRFANVDMENLDLVNVKVK